MSAKTLGNFHLVVSPPTIHHPSSYHRRGVITHRLLPVLALFTLLWLLGSVQKNRIGISHTGHLSPTSTSIEKDEEIERCLLGSDWSRDSKRPPVEIEPGFYSLNSTFSLPVYSDGLYFLARGPLSIGVIGINSADNIDDVIVNIEVKYNLQDWLDKSAICFLKRDGDMHGIGIFSPKSWEKPKNRGVRASWQVNITIPTGAIIPEFSTDTFLFSHYFGALGNSVLFRKLNITSSISPIEIESLVAETALIKTAFAPVRGNFNVSDKLVIRTNISPVDINVQLNNSPSKNTTTSAYITTSMAPLKAQFALVSSAPSRSEGNFNLSTSTSFAPLDLAFITIPVDSVVNVAASTMSSPVNVSLTEAFEGTLQARSSFEQITFIAADAEDPKGQHRKRHVETNQRGPLNEILEGEVYWEGEGRAAPLGSVDVQTSAAEITLLL